MPSVGYWINRSEVLSEYLWIFFIVELLSSNPSTDEMISNGVRQGVIVVPRSRYIAILDEGVVQMATEGFLGVGHILHLSNSSYADLLSFVVIRLRLGCHRYTRPAFREANDLATTTKTADRLEVPMIWSPTSKTFKQPSLVRRPRPLTFIRISNAPISIISHYFIALSKKSNRWVKLYCQHDIDGSYYYCKLILISSS